MCNHASAVATAPSASSKSAANESTDPRQVPTRFGKTGLQELLEKLSSAGETSEEVDLEAPWGEEVDLEAPWGEEETAFLLKILMQGADHSFSGWRNIANDIASGKEVLTPLAAADIWKGGIGNFIVGRQPEEESSGVTYLRIDPRIWGSRFLIDLHEIDRQKLSWKKAVCHKESERLGKVKLRSEATLRKEQAEADKEPDGSQE